MPNHKCDSTCECNHLIKTNDLLDVLSIVDKLTKKKSDMYRRWVDLLLAYETKLELQLVQAFDVAKEQVLSKLSTLDQVYNKSLMAEFVKDLMDVPFEPRIVHTHVGIFRFKKFTFSREIRNWLEKANRGKVIDSISEINTDPFAEPINDSVFNSYKSGGQSVFAIFDIPLVFNLRDKNVESYLKNKVIQLSEQVAKELQTKIKFQILDGIKNADSIPQIRNRILEVFNAPIDVVVPPSVAADGTIIRQGYSYQLSPKQWATTVARTEVSEAYNKGRLEGFRQSGVVESVEFSTSPDERLCPVCANLDGSQYPVGDSQTDSLIPQHANCRCQWIPILYTDDFTEAKATATSNIESIYSST